MIHQHYEPAQILWFLRNYWKFTRENMVAEWHRVFGDSNFAKSQYQWLKSRYGMKEEWGASLNHPPFSGARPGVPGTEDYEPPSVPQTAPRMTFRTRAESPTPNLVTASAEPQTPAPGTSARGGGSRRRAGGSYTQTPGNPGNPGMPGMPAYAANYQAMMGSGMPSSTSTTIQTPMATPVATPSMSAAGATMFNANGAARSHGNHGNGSKGPHGTYSFAGLGSPFAHNGAGMVSNGPNPIASSFAQGNNASLPTNANMFNMGSQEAWANSQFQAAHHPFNPMAGDDFANPNAAHAAHGFMPGNNGNGGLGIDPNMPFFQGAPHLMSPQDMANYYHNAMPTSMPMATSMSMPGMSSTAGHVEAQPNGRRPSAPVYSNAEIIESVMRKHSPLNKTTADATGAPQESLGSVSPGSKRKRGPVEVEFNPPKRAMLAPSPDMTGTEVQLIAGSRPDGLSSALEVSKVRHKKSASPSTGSPEAVVTVSDNEPQTSSQSVSSASPSTPGSPSVVPASTSCPVEVWHEGTHNDCTIRVCHRHNGDTLCFKAFGDFEKAAESYIKDKSMAAAKLPTPVLPSHVTDKVFDLVSRPGVADADTKMEATEEVQVPSQDEPQAQSPVAAQGSAIVEAQVKHQPQEVQAELQTQADAPASAPEVSSVDAAVSTASTSGIDASIEDLVRTHIAASLLHHGNTAITTSMPVTTGEPAVSTAAFSAQILAPVHHNVVPSKVSDFVPSLEPDFFAGGHMDLESYGFDNISITDAYHNGTLGGTASDDLFDMLDDSQF